MFAESIEPDEITFASILKACTSIGADDYGDLIYTNLLENAQELGSFAGSALITFYFKCRRPDDARKVFDAVSDGCTGVVWNAMIVGSAIYWHFDEGLRLFQHMQAMDMELEKSTFVSVLSPQMSFHEAKRIAVCIEKRGFESDAVVGSALLHVLTNLGKVEDACRVFAKVLEKDVITWTTMVAFYARQGCSYKALSSLQKMQEDGIQPNSITFVSGLKACINGAAFQQGNLVHHNVVEHGCESDLFVGSVLIDMYVKCESLQDSRAVFDRMWLRDLVAWNGIIRGYGQRSDLGELLQLVCSMQCQGFKPNNVTFSSILSACSSLGAKVSSCQTLQYMQAYEKTLTLDVCNRIIDLFARSGDLKKSNDLLHAVPYANNTVGRRSLLSHCRTHENLQLGLQCFDIVSSRKGNYSAGYALMPRPYNWAGVRKDARKIEALKNFANAQKLPGEASVLIDDKLNGFAIADKTQFQSDEVYLQLNQLSEYVRLKDDLPASDVSRANLTRFCMDVHESLASDEQAHPLWEAAG